MTEDTGLTPNEGQEPEAPEAGQAPAEAEKTFSESYVKELRDEAASWRKKLRELEADAEKRQQADADAAKAKLKEQEKWRELAEASEAKLQELEPLQAKVTQFEALVTEMLEARLTEFGDAGKKAVEALPEGLSDLDKLNWLNANVELFKRPTAPELDASTRGDPADGPEATDEEVKEFAARLGLDPRYVDKRQIPLTR
jgi:hypothetical protein